MRSSIVHHKSDRKPCVIPTADRNNYHVLDSALDVLDDHNSDEEMDTKPSRSSSKLSLDDGLPFTMQDVDPNITPQSTKVTHIFSA